MTGQTSLFPPEPAPDPLLCWLWLSQVLGPASLHAGKVLDAFGGAQEAWEARETEEFRQAAGDTAFKRAAQLDAESFHTLVMQCDALRVRILPFDDPDYPLAFSRIPDMPLVLYCTGDPRWLNEPGAVGIVGSRKPTEYGLNAAADIGGELAKNGAYPSTAPTRQPMPPCASRSSARAASSASTRLTVNMLVLTAFCSATGSLRRCPLPYWWWKRGKKAAPCPPLPTPSAMASRCTPCRGASTPPTPQVRTACCGTDAPGPWRALPAPLSDTERRVLAGIGPKPVGIEELCVSTGLPMSALLGTLMKLELTGRVYKQPGQRYVLR